MLRYKRYDVLNYEMLFGFMGKVNSKPIWGHEPGRVRMTWGAVRQFDGERQWWDVTFRVTIEPQTYSKFGTDCGLDAHISNRHLYGEADLTEIEDSVEIPELPDEPDTPTIVG